MVGVNIPLGMEWTKFKANSQFGSQFKTSNGPPGVFLAYGSSVNFAKSLNNYSLISAISV